MPPLRPRRKAASAKPYDRESPDGSDSKPDLDQLEDEYQLNGQEDELDEDVKPDVDEKPAKKRSPRKTSKAASTAGAGTGAKWTADEDWALFQAIFPRAQKIDWSSVSAGVGRDAKACQNRFYVLEKKKKLEQAIKAISKTAWTTS